AFVVAPDSATVGFSRSGLYSAFLPGDSDGDSIQGPCDVCPHHADPAQTDTDLDGIGQACDNCPATANPDQRDSNHDGTGDACTVDATPPAVLAMLPAPDTLD